MTLRLGVATCEVYWATQVSISILTEMCLGSVSGEREISASERVASPRLGVGW